MNLYLKLTYIILIVLVCSSCKITKSNVITDKEIEQNTMSYIHLFHEANKSRLSGYNDLAEEQFLRALSKNPNSAASFYFLARIEYENNKNSLALDYATRAVNINDSNFWYNFLLAKLLVLNEQYSAAEKLYLKLIKQHNDDKSLYTSLQMLYSESSNYSKLKSLYLTMFQKFGYTDSNVQNLIYLYYDTNDFDGAFTFINNLITEFPTNIFYKVLLAEHYSVTKKYDKAKVVYIQMYDNEESNKYFILSYSKFAYILKDTSTYFSILLRAASSKNITYSNKKPILAQNVEQLLSIKQLSIIYNSFYNSHSDKFLPNKLLANLYFQQNDYKSAYSFYKQALKIDNSDFTLVLNLLESENKLALYQELVTDSKFYIDFYPNKSIVHFYHGKALYFTKQYNKASTTLEYGLNFVYNDNLLTAKFYHYLALSNIALKKYTQSNDNFSRMYEISNIYYEGISDYAGFLAQRNINIDFAMELSEQCLSRKPESNNFVYNHACVLLKMKEYSQSLIFMEKLPINYLVTEKQINNYADILFMNNYNDKAVVYWNKAYKINSNNLLFEKINNYNKISKSEFFNKYILKN